MQRKSKVAIGLAILFLLLSSPMSFAQSYTVERNADGPRGEKIYDIKNPKMKIAVLIYRSYYMDFFKDIPPISDLRTLRLKIKTHNFEEENKDIFSRYGHEVEERKNGEFWISGRQTRETLDGALYPKEFDTEINTFILKLLMQNGCSIVDLTPIKKEFDSVRLADIIKKYSSEEKIDGFFILYYQLYSHCMRPVSGNGLMCLYKMMFINPSATKALFHDEGFVHAPIPVSDASWGRMNLNAPVEWIENDGKHKRGIINRKWMETNFLNELKSDKPVLGGKDMKQKAPPELERLSIKLRWCFESLEKKKLGKK